MGEFANADVEVLIEAGYEARRRQQSEDAKTAFQRAVDLSWEAVAASREQSRQTLARSLTGLGQIERDMGNLPAALDLYQEAADLYRGLSQPLHLAHTVRHVGEILRVSGRFELAEPCYAEALGIYRSDLKTPVLDLANTLRGYALLKAEIGDAATAIELWQEAGNLYGSLNVTAGFEESRRQVAVLSIG